MNLSLSALCKLSIVKATTWNDEVCDPSWAFAIRYAEIRKAIPLARRVYEIGNEELNQKMAAALKPDREAIRTMFKNWEPTTRQREFQN